MFVTSIFTILIIYSILIIITSFLSNRKYSYRVYQPFNNGIIAPFLRPVMYLFGYQKVTHWFDWEVFDRIIIENVTGLEFKTDTTKRNMSQTFSLTNAFVSLGSIEKAAIIEPENYLGNWSLVFQINNTCKVNTLKYPGKVKIILDGSVSLYALGEDNKIYKLRLIETIIRKNHLKVLHI